ncbi:hypothetical protein HDE_03745 [Halotydeus destructor]|nr:hypothetical protein HDE_03745 [Halotydeus destructor]
MSWSYLFCFAICFTAVSCDKCKWPKQEDCWSLGSGESLDSGEVLVPVAPLPVQETVLPIAYRSTFKLLPNYRAIQPKYFNQRTYLKPAVSYRKVEVDKLKLQPILSDQWATKPVVYQPQRLLKQRLISSPARFASAPMVSSSLPTMASYQWPQPQETPFAPSMPVNSQLPVAQRFASGGQHMI